MVRVCVWVSCVLQRERERERESLIVCRRRNSRCVSCQGPRLALIDPVTASQHRLSFLLPLSFPWPSLYLSSPSLYSSTISLTFLFSLAHLSPLSLSLSLSLFPSLSLSTPLSIPPLRPLRCDGKVARQCGVNAAVCQWLCVPFSISQTTEPFGDDEFPLYPPTACLPDLQLWSYPASPGLLADTASLSTDRLKICSIYF